MVAYLGRCSCYPMVIPLGGSIGKAPGRWRRRQEAWAAAPAAIVAGMVAVRVSTLTGHLIYGLGGARGMGTPRPLQQPRLRHASPPLAGDGPRPAPHRWPLLCYMGRSSLRCPEAKLSFLFICYFI